MPLPTKLKRLNKYKYSKRKLQRENEIKAFVQTSSSPPCLSVVLDFEEGFARDDFMERDLVSSKRDVTVVQDVKEGFAKYDIMERGLITSDLDVKDCDIVIDDSKECFLSYLDNEQLSHSHILQGEFMVDI